MVDFSAVRDSGLSQAEIARVLGVSRVTVNLWLNGKMNPHRYNAHNVELAVNSLTAAIKSGLIPKRTKGRSLNAEQIRAAIQQVQSEATA